MRYDSLNVKVMPARKRQPEESPGERPEDAAPSPALAAPDKTGLRRVPTQERSRRRFESILDAAAVLFASDGFEGTTMEHIASAAATSIGSVYQFFPAKEAIFTAVAERCLARTRTLVEGMLSSWPAERHWAELVDLAVDGVWAQHREDLDLRALLRNVHLYGTFAAADAALMEEMIGGVAVLLKRYTPSLSRARANLLATVVVNAISALLFVCEREPPQKARRLVAETKALVRSYLEGALPAPEAEDG